MGTVVAIANQKGGVAKTTTTHALGVALADRGAHVLLVDLDPQAGLTYSAGIDPDDVGHSVHDVLLGRVPLDVVIAPVGGGGSPHLVPASIDLAGSEIVLLSRAGREHTLRRVLTPVADAYDWVLVDCPPSLGILTINALTAADDVLIPLSCETLSRRGVDMLLDTIDDVRRYTNPDLTVRGVVATMVDRRRKVTRELLADLPESLGLPLVGPPVPTSVKAVEAPSRRVSVVEHAPRSTAAAAYRELAEVLDRARSGAQP
jgi:chromosome partitioning protein